MAKTILDEVLEVYELADREVERAIGSWSSLSAQERAYLVRMKMSADPCARKALEGGPLVFLKEKLRDYVRAARKMRRGQKEA